MAATLALSAGLYLPPFKTGKPRIRRMMKSSMDEHLGNEKEKPKLNKRPLWRGGMDRWTGDFSLSPPSCLSLLSKRVGDQNKKLANRYISGHFPFCLCLLERKWEGEKAGEMDRWTAILAVFAGLYLSPFITGESGRTNPFR